MNVKIITEFPPYWWLPSSKKPHGLPRVHQDDFLVEYEPLGSEEVIVTARFADSSKIKNWSSEGRADAKELIRRFYGDSHLSIRRDRTRVCVRRKTKHHVFDAGYLLCQCLNEPD